MQTSSWRRSKLVISGTSTVLLSFVTLSKCALPRVIKAGLTRANKGETEILSAIEEATLEVVPEITKRTPSLQAVANVATLLGLLGTIVGLIQAFDAVATAPAEKDHHVDRIYRGCDEHHRFRSYRRDSNPRELTPS